MKRINVKGHYRNVERDDKGRFTSIKKWHSRKPISLDVGCGGSKPSHRKKAEIGLDLNRDSPYIDVRADAQHLPFRSATFHKVVASHVLEHLQDPVAALTEIRRVLTSQGFLEAYVPSRYGERHPDPHHIHHWNRQEFRHLLKTVFPSVKTTTGKACWIPIRGNRYLWGPYLVRLFPKLASELRANCSSKRKRDE